MKNSKIILILLSCFFTLNSFTQTKMIFHKSHSGTYNTLNLDSYNNYGPGMAPERYRVPVLKSPIVLKYLNEYVLSYPLVILDTNRKIMRFVDVKDSIIGCARNYNEYLNEGTIVFDIITNDYFVYQKYLYQSKSEVFIKATDSIQKWEIDNKIRSSRNYILDGKRRQITTNYPLLYYKITRNLKQVSFEENTDDIIPIKINHKKIEEENKRIEKEEKSQINTNDIRNLNKKNMVNYNNKSSVVIKNISPKIGKKQSKYSLYVLAFLSLILALFLLYKKWEKKNF